MSLTSSPRIWGLIGTSANKAPSRYVNTTSQLDAGVRLVTAQVHKKDSEWHLCHSGCDYLDAGKLSSWLSEIKDWLDNNKNDGMFLVTSHVSLAR